MDGDALRPPKPGFHQLIEQAVLEYDLLQARLVDLAAGAAAAAAVAGDATPRSCLRARHAGLPAQGPQSQGAQEGCRGGEEAKRGVSVHGGAAVGGQRLGLARLPALLPQPDEGAPNEGPGHGCAPSESSDDGAGSTPRRTTTGQSSNAAGEASPGRTAVFNANAGSEDRAAWLREQWARLTVSVNKWQDKFVLRQCWQEDALTTNSGVMAYTSGIHSLSSQPGDVVLHCWALQSGPVGKSKSRLSVFGEPAGPATKSDVSANACMFHPYSVERTLWVSFGMFLLLTDVFVSTMSVFGLDRQLWLEFVALIFWSCDILASFRSGVYTHAGLNMVPRSIALQYLKRWFWIDSLLVVFEWFTIMLDIGGPAASSAGLFRYVKVAKHVRLIRLAKFDFMMRQLAQRIQSLWVLLFLKMSLYLFGVFAWVHLSATMWYAIGTLDEGGWVSEVQEFSALPLNYISSLQWAAAQLQGNVDIYPRLPLERAFASCHLIASVVVMALLVSKLTTVMHSMQEMRAEKLRLMLAARKYLQQHQISPELSVNVKNYLSQKQAVDAKHSHNQDEELLQVLPAELRRALLEEARSPTLEKHVLFMAIHRCNRRCFQRLCCDLLQPKAVMPDENIFCGGVVCLRLHFVVAGKTSYFSYGQVMSTLLNSSAECMHSGSAGQLATAGYSRETMWRNSMTFSRWSLASGGGMTPTGSNRSSANRSSANSDLLDRARAVQSVSIQEGSYLCEAAVWVHWIHRGDFDALSQASLLVLEVMALEELVTSYVATQRPLQKHAVRMVESLNEAPWLTDMFSTKDVLANTEAPRTSGGGSQGLKG